MKVDKNQPFDAVIPIRLEIAAKLLAAKVVRIPIDDEFEFWAKFCLEMADALIKVHNETCEDEQ